MCELTICTKNYQSIEISLAGVDRYYIYFCFGSLPLMCELAAWKTPKTVLLLAGTRRRITRRELMHPRTYRNTHGITDHS
jgi:hypothetical protein